MHQVFLKKTNLAGLKLDFDELDIDKLKCVRSGLSNLKSKQDKLEVAKLVPVFVDLSKLSDVVKHNAVKKTEYDKMIKKVNVIDNSGFVKETRLRF